MRRAEGQRSAMLRLAGSGARTVARDTDQVELGVRDGEPLGELGAVGWGVRSAKATYGGRVRKRRVLHRREG